MKKRFLIVLSVLSIGTFAYGSAIVSVQNGSAQSSITSSIINTRSNIQSSSVGIQQNPTELIKQFNKDKTNYETAIDLFKMHFNNGKYRLASNVLIEHYISSGGSISNLAYQFVDYLNSIKRPLINQLALTPDNADVDALLAGITLNTDSASTALNFAQKANELNPKRYSPLLAKLYYVNGNYAQAAELFKNQLASFPSDYDSMFYRAKSLSKMGKTKEVKNDYKQLIAMNRYTNEATEELFNILCNENASDSEIISTLLPKNRGLSTGNAYKLLIEKMINIHAYPTAERMIQKAEPYSADADLYLSAAEEYVKNNEVQRAKVYLEKSKRLLNSDKDVSRYNIVSARFSGEQLKGANDLALSGRYDDAISLYQTSKNPESVESLLGMANSYAGMGNDAKAMSYLNKAMSLYPDNPDVYYSFAKYFADTGDVETARKYINNALRLSPKNPKIIQLSNQLKGQKLDDLFDDAFSAFDAQNYPETLSILNKITKIEPDNYTAYYYKGLTYGNMNNYSAAITEFLKAKSLNPQFVFVNYLLGVAYDNLGEPVEAKKYYSTYLNNENNITSENSEYINYARSRVQKL